MSAVCQTPNAATAAGRCYFRIAMPCRIEEILRPYVDRIGASVAAMIKINGGERVIFGENITDTVAVAGLHSR